MPKKKVKLERDSLLEVLGFFAAPSRLTRIEAELSQKDKDRFETKYKYLTGISPTHDNDTYYLWKTTDPDAKFGIELRVYFHANKIPQCIQSLITKCGRQDAKYKKFNHRINNNDLIWLLIQYGFRLGEVQNTIIIIQKIIEKFNEGYII